jgi:hypothetical protein
VVDLRRGDADHLASGETGALGEVETGGDGGKQRVEPTQTLGEVAAHQHRRRLDESDLTDDVVLLEVDLPLVEPRVRLAEHVGGTSDRLQFVHRPCLEQLRPGQRGFVPLDLGDECAQGVGTGPGVGVEQPQIVERRVGGTDRRFEGRCRGHSVVQLEVLAHNHDLGSRLVDLPSDHGHRCLEVGVCYCGDEYTHPGRAGYLVESLIVRQLRSRLGHANCHCEPVRGTEQYRTMIGMGVGA